MTEYSIMKEEIKVKKHMLVSMIILCVAGLIMGCSDKKEKNIDANQTSAEAGGELKVGFSAQPPGLDPHATTAQATATVMRHVFETLVTVDSDYNVKPMLAESYEQSDDGKTITFHLREGVQFHNGEEMKAEDVVASMNRWIEISSLGEDYFEGAIFKEEDDYTVVLELPEPLSTALTILSVGSGNLAAIMPKEIIEEADDTGVTEFVGTGPFKYEEWKQDQHLLLEKYEDYQPREEESDGLAGKREALVDELYFVFSSDAATQVAGLQSSEYDAIDTVPRDNAEQLEHDPSLNLFKTPGVPTNIIYNKKVGLFTDVQAREAVNTALNMEEILTAAYSSDAFYDLSFNLVPPNQEGQWSSEIGKDKYNVHDTEKAKELLDEAGYKDEALTMITTRDYPSFYDSAVVIQEQLKQLGMNVELEVYDWPSLVDIRDDEDEWDLLVLNNSVKPEPTAQVFLRDDFAGWTEDEELDKIIKSFRGAPSVEETDSAYDELQTWFWDYIPVTLVGYNKQLSATSANVDGYTTLEGPIFWNVTNNK